MILELNWWTIPLVILLTSVVVWVWINERRGDWELHWAILSVVLVGGTGVALGIVIGKLFL